MLILALCIIALGFVLLGWSIRGRVAGRGRFCAHCRFDLAGLEFGAGPTPCPECGRSIGAAGTIRTIRRQRRSKMLLVAVVIIVAGSAIIAVPITGNTGAIIARMPDRVVLYTAQRGSIPALDELIARLAGPRTLPEWVWSDAIEAALEYQADTTTVWEPRWGEVITLAWSTQRMSDEQKGRFARNGIRIKVWIRDRLQAGERSVGLWVDFTGDRASGINMYKTPYDLRHAIVVTGGTHDQERWSLPGGAATSSSFIIPANGPTGTSGLGSGVQVSKSIAELLRPGDALEVFVELQSTLVSTSDASEIPTEPIRFTQRVTVVGPDEPIVEVVKDPMSAKQLLEGTSISPILGLRADAPDRQAYDDAGGFALNFTQRPRAIAGTLSLRHHLGGELFEATTLNVVATPKLTGQGIWNFMSGHSISIDPNDHERNALYQRVTRDGVVDVIFRTDPQAASLNPKIAQIVDVDMVFRGVPVVFFELRGDMQEAQAQMPKIAASELVED